MVIIIAIAFFSQWSGNGLVSYYLNAVFKTIGITDTTIQLLITAYVHYFREIVTFIRSFRSQYPRYLELVLGCRSLLLRRARWSPSALPRLRRRHVHLLHLPDCLLCPLRRHWKPTGCARCHCVHLPVLRRLRVSLSHRRHCLPSVLIRAFSLAFTPLIVMYTVEILPYSLRAKGFNVFNFVISLALIFNQYVNPIALEHIAWKYYVSLFTVCDSYMTLNRAPTDRLLLLDRLRVRLPLHLHR